eukprot:scaffold105557_cov39-Tisochrysis_lutea.AAC.4
MYVHARRRMYVGASVASTLKCITPSERPIVQGTRIPGSQYVLPPPSCPQTYDQASTNGIA